MLFSTDSNIPKAINNNILEALFFEFRNSCDEEII